MKTGGAAALVFFLLLTIAPSAVREAAPASAGSSERGGGIGAQGPFAEGNGLSTLLADGRRKAELLGYAKGVFLAALGFAEAVRPPDFLTKVQRACFVTFFSGRKVIACFGGFYPRTGNIAQEIRDNVGMALRFDPRARFIDRRTALAVRVQITFPGGPEPVASYKEINPFRDGLLVENDRQGVAIVPGEAKTASWAYREALRRLDESDPARVRVFRFRAFAVSSGR